MIEEGEGTQHTPQQPAGESGTPLSIKTFPILLTCRNRMWLSAPSTCHSFFTPISTWRNKHRVTHREAPHTHLPRFPVYLIHIFWIQLVWHSQQLFIVVTSAGLSEAQAPRCTNGHNNRQRKEKLKKRMKENSWSERCNISMVPNQWAEDQFQAVDHLVPDYRDSISLYMIS